MFHQRFFKLTIVNKENVDRFFEEYERAKQIFFDFETSGLDVRYKGKDYAVGLTIAFEDSVSKEVYYIPFRHYFEGSYIGCGRLDYRKNTAVFDDAKNFPDFLPEKFSGEYYNMDIVDFMERLKPLMENGGKEYIAHHISFDLHLFANEGVDIVKVFETNTFTDTQIAVHTLDEEQEKNLEAVTETIFSVKKSHFKDTIMTVTKEEKKLLGLASNSNASFQHVQIPIGAQYSAEDVYFMKEMYEPILNALREDGGYEYFREVRMPYMKVLWKMERNGIKVDIEKLESMIKLAEEKLEELTYKIYEVVGAKFNINSGQQLFEILYGFKKKLKDRKTGEYRESFNEDLVTLNFGFQPIAWTDGGKSRDIALRTPKTDKDALKKLLRQTPKREDGHKLIKLLQDYFKLTKLYTAFMLGIKEKIYCDGKVHPSFNQNGCLVANTLIPTDRGLFRIQDLVTDALVDGEFVSKTYTLLNRNLEPEKTSHIVKYENRNTIKIRTALGVTIEGTENHPIICNKYSSKDLYLNRNSCRFKNLYKKKDAQIFKRLDEINTETYVAVPYGYNFFAKDYQKLEYEYVAMRSGFKQVKLPEILDEDVAEFMGMYYADGCLSDTNGTFTICFTNGDSCVINRIQELSLRLFGIKAHVRDCHPHRNSFDIRISAKRLASIEKAFQLKRGCTNKVIPDIILQSPRSVVIAFIKGMTLDSYFVEESNKKQLRFTVSNEQSLLQLQTLLLNLGIIGGARHLNTYTGNVYMLTLTNGEYLKFRDIVGFVQKKKYKDFEYQRISGQYLVDEGNSLIWVKVKEIDKGRADVYDFTLPETHSFISNGFISHNTSSFRLSCSEPN